MSDLSDLLGDVYGYAGDPDGPPVTREATAADRGPVPFDGRDDDWAPRDQALPVHEPTDLHRGGDPLTEALAAAVEDVVPDAAVHPVQPAPPPAPAPPPIPVAPAPAPAPMVARTEAVPAWDSADTDLPAAPWVPADDDIVPGDKSRKRGR